MRISTSICVKYADVAPPPQTIDFSERERAIIGYMENQAKPVPVEISQQSGVRLPDSGVEVVAQMPAAIRSHVFATGAGDIPPNVLASNRALPKGRHSMDEL